jgi:hypothetical protein
MALRPRRYALDALTVLLAMGGITLIAIGGRPPSIPERSSATDLAAMQGPPAPSRSPGTARSRSPGTAGSAAPVIAGSPAPFAGKRKVLTGPAPLGRSVPTHLDIPAIGLSTSLMALGLNTDGTIVVPPLRHNAPAGWYQYLATPGETGPAVILGHVDTARDGPAVFYRLRELRAGDAVTVHRADGSSAVFTVNQVTEYPKSAFPANAVYGSVDRPVLRLITCGGTFDHLRHQYRSNVIAFATMTGTTPAR